MTIEPRHGIDTRPWATTNNGTRVAWGCCFELPPPDASFIDIYVVLPIGSRSVVNETLNRLREEVLRLR